MFNSNSRGFNLFSAIVAAVLFMAGVMLVQTMVSTEDRISGQIFSMEENFALSDAANLSRSDSLQTFNYHFRERLEEYLTNPKNEFPILYRKSNGTTNYDNPEKDWDLVVQEFEEQILLIEPGGEMESFERVLNFVSDKMIDEFRTGAYGRYHVKLDITNTANAKALLTEKLKNAIQASQDEGEPFIEVVDCDMDAHKACRLGTFFFNIPLDKIEDAEYEELPRIIVKDIVTGEEIKIAILPKSNLRVYVPLRFFKAVHTASLHYSESVKDNHNSFSNMRLGYCGSNCSPTNDPYSTASGNSARSMNCVVSADPNGSADLQTLKTSYVGVSTYATYGNGTGGKGLKAAAIDAICGYWGNAVEGLESAGTDSFYNVDLMDPNKKGLEKGIIVPAVKVDPCPFSKITVESGTFKTKGLKISGGTSSTLDLYCGQIKSVEAVIDFIDTDPSYTVKGVENHYRIKIVDEEFELEPNRENECCSTGRNTCHTDTC